MASPEDASTRPGVSHRPGAGEGPWLAAIAIGYAFLVHRFWFVCDDAYISFRFARNLARGHGLRYNLGDHTPVEGYSNFLWTVIAAGFEWLGTAPAATMPWLSVACGAVLLVWLHRVLRAIDVPARVALLAVASVALFPPFAVWSTSGLATMPMALLVFGLWERLSLGRGSGAFWGAIAFAVALALLRTEGIAWVAVIVAVTGLSRLSTGEPMGSVLRRAIGVLGLALVLFLPYFAWRAGYYGAWLSNTAAAKSGLTGWTLERGFDYVAVMVLSFPLPVIALLGAIPGWKRARSLTLSCGLLGLGFPAYAVVVGGDFMAMGRFLIPAVPFAAILGAFALERLGERWPERRALVPAVACIGWVVSLGPVWDVHPTPHALRSRFHFRLNAGPRYQSELRQWRSMEERTQQFRRRGQALARISEPGDSGIAAAIGAFGYYSDLFVYDRVGLVTREVALRDVPSQARYSPGHDKMVDRSFFLHHRPTFVVVRLFDGPNARALMTQLFEGWSFSSVIRSEYVPDAVEIEGDGSSPSYLMMVRRPKPGEDPAALWEGFRDRLWSGDLAPQMSQRTSSTSIPPSPLGITTSVPSRPTVTGPS